MICRPISIVVALTLCGCSAMQVCPQRHAEVREAAMSCAELNRVTAAAVKRLGYNIDSFSPASSEKPGKLQGSRRDDYDDTYTIAVDLRCSASEASADAVASGGCASQIAFPNTFRESFTASKVKKVVHQPLTRPEEQTGLRIEIEPLRDADRAVGAPLAAANLMAVKVVITNRTSRVYRLDDGSIALTSQDGAKVATLPPADAAKRISAAKPDAKDALARLEQNALRTGDIQADGKAEGFLYLPRQAYRRATVKLLDVEAEEPEGFSVEF